MKGYYYFMIGMILCLTSCKDTSTTSTTMHDNLNAPVITNVTNSFTYSINANQYSAKSNNDLSFLSDSLVVTLSSGTHSSGQAIISVSDSSNAMIFSDTVKSNKTIVITNFKTKKPNHCNLDITNLTAKLSFVVVGQ